jgi:hypothetical protein
MRCEPTPRSHADRPRARRSRHRAGRLVRGHVRALLAFATLPALLGTASPAAAGVFFGAGPNLPSPLIVGQTDVAATLTLTNLSNGAEAGLNVALGAITFIPSCGTQTITSADCPAANTDPGVLAVSSTGTGAAGACAATSFTTSVLDATEGKYQFSPSTPVVLGPPGSATATCVIDFTFSVLKAPTQDAASGVSGLQTEQVAFSSGIATDGVHGGGLGDNEITVSRAPLTIATTAALLDNHKLSDTATLAGAPAGSPVPTGTVTFRVYAPGDATCSAAPVFTATDPVNAAGTTAVSNAFTPTPASGGTGTYRFTAAYGGDANYLPVSSHCNDANEAVTIPTPVIGVTKAATPASEVAPGGTFTFTATVSNPSAVDPITITTLTDNIYGNLATLTGSTCASLIGTTLAPGASSPPCSFPGAFTGTAGQSQTDTVTVNGVDSNGFTATATANATVTLTPVPPPPPPPPPAAVRPQIGVTKAATPLTLPAPGGTFTFTVTVSNPSAVSPVTITNLTDNIYGNLATRTGSTCGRLIGVTLAAGATTAPCSFPGTFTGSADASQTDIVTVTATYNGTTVMASANATVKLTTVTPSVAKPAAVVKATAFHRPAGCVSAATLKIYVTGANIRSVGYTLAGRHLGTVTKPDASGRYLLSVRVRPLGFRVYRLTAVVTYKTGKKRTLNGQIVRCRPPRVPLFTG